MRFWVPLILFLYVIVLGVLLGGVYVVSGQLKQIDANITSEQTAIKSMEKNEQVYMQLKQKSAALAQILPSRLPYANIYGYFQQKVSQSLNLGRLTISEAGEVSLNMHVSDSETLDAFINQVLADAETRFSRVEFVSLQSEFPKGYSVEMQFAVKTAP
ncbi:MAG: hypothetical protein AAB874_04445 [Patescibacteria group bacterium]